MNGRRENSLGREFAPGLFHVAGPPIEEIDANALVAITKIRDEAWRLPFWLAYYRWLGTTHFVIIDNKSVDNLHAIVAGRPDVTVIDAPGNLQGPAGYRYWTNAVVKLGPPQRWNLIVDADELFVAAPWRKGGLRETAEALDAEGADVAYALMVDCYPDLLPPQSDTASAIPWQRASWFDPGPYGRWLPWNRKVSLTYRGARERVCFPDWWYQKYLPERLRRRLGLPSAPYIVKVPLVKSSADVSRGIHGTASRRRPSSYFNLLHYKFDVDLEHKSKAALAHRQYFRQSAEYRIYAAALEGKRLELRTPQSRTFSGLESLRDAKLCRYDSDFMRRVTRTGPIDTDLNRAVSEILAFGDDHLAPTVSVAEIGSAVRPQQLD